MAGKIFKSDNYLIIESGANSYEYAIGNTVYTRNDEGGTDKFEIIESNVSSRAAGRYIIPVSEITAGDWTDEALVVYSEATFTTFLRVNTGFKPASGGSGAVPLGFGYTKTGQTISYATGDDGDFEAGRGLDFFSLSVNNPHGNRERFTDELGTQVYANNIIIDWTTYDNKTALGIHRTPTPNANWNTQLTYCSGLTVGTFSTWRMANIREVLTFMNFSLVGGGIFGWSPFSNSGILIMSSTTYIYAANFYYGSGSGSVATVGYAYAGSTIPVRTFNKAELGL